jgi:hypothetical protein
MADTFVKSFERDCVLCLDGRMLKVHLANWRFGSMITTCASSGVADALATAVHSHPFINRRVSCAYWEQLQILCCH